jgi:hypothetical protein
MPSSGTARSLQSALFYYARGGEVLKLVRMKSPKKKTIFLVRSNIVMVDLRHKDVLAAIMNEAN